MARRDKGLVKTGSKIKVKLESVSGKGSMDLRKIGCKMPVKVESVSGEEGMDLRKTDSKITVKVESVSDKGGMDLRKTDSKMPVKVESVNGKGSMDLRKTGSKMPVKVKSVRGKGGMDLQKRGSTMQNRVHPNRDVPISKAGVRRLARRVGIKQMSAEVVEFNQNMCKAFLETVIPSAVFLTERAERTTVTSQDVLDAIHILKRDRYL